MKFKRSFAVVALLLLTMLVLPIFVGCGKPSLEKDNPNMVSYENNFIHGPFFSAYASLKVTLSLSSNVTFECHAIGDCYYIDGKLKDKTINSGEILYLDALSNNLYDNPPNGYITIIAKDGNNIVGYAVLALKPLYFSESGDLQGWNLETVKSVEFPQVDGQYQDVSEAYVQRQFRKYTR